VTLNALGLGDEDSLVALFIVIRIGTMMISWKERASEVVGAN
jgi:hypothetical protein